MTLKPKMTPGKKISFIFTQNQPDARLFETPVQTFMQMVGLTGLAIQDHMLACDLDAGMKPPVEEKTDLMEEAYRIGRELL